MAKSGFFAYLTNGSEFPNETFGQEQVVQDQDTVIGDAMVEAAQLFYNAASDIATCINENCQEAIDLNKVRRAALALAYMQGVDVGLALDNKIQRWYLLEMQKSMATILESRNAGFQTQIYVPIAPWMVMDYDPIKCAGRTTFLSPLSMRQPEKKGIERAKKEIMDDESLKQHLQKMAEEKYPALFDVFPELERPLAKEEKPASDDSPSVTKLRNLYRQNKIDKGQYIGSLATLLATGLIDKPQFTRLKAGA